MFLLWFYQFCKGDVEAIALVREGARLRRARDAPGLLCDIVLGRMNYLALLRGVNVGGKGLLRMSELKECLEKAGFAEVRTYIQSGNVLFAAPKTAPAPLAQKIEAAIEKKFAMKVGVVVFSETEWREIVQRAPKFWGEKEDWKHNLLALLPGTKAADVMKAVGTLKPEIEAMTTGQGVLYQSLSIDSFGRTNSGKLAGHSIYRRITVRNHNTARKLAELLATPQVK